MTIRQKQEIFLSEKIFLLYRSTVKYFGKMQSVIFRFCTILSKDEDWYTGYPTPVTWRKIILFSLQKSKTSSIRHPWSKMVREDAISSSFSYSLEHFRALWRHHTWRMTPASASAPSSSSSNVRKLMEVFFWKTDSFLYLTQRKIQSQLFLKEIRKKIQYSRISIWKKGKNGC